jgi:guanidinopropionase
MTASHIGPIHPVTNRSPFDLCRIGDGGDVATNPLDLSSSIAAIEAFFQRFHAAGVAPLAVGGDHLVTLPILRALGDKNPLGLVHFDAHTDTNAPVYGAAVPYDNGMPFRRAVEEGLLDPRRVIQIGMRGTRYGTDELDYSLASGMRVIDIEEYFALGPERVVAEARRVVGEGPAYLTFDIDSLDAIHVPGTASPEIGGYSPREAQVMIRGLRALELVGADLVEVAPPLDPSGNTARLAANLLFEICYVLAESVARRKANVP